MKGTGWKLAAVGALLAAMAMATAWTGASWPARLERDLPKMGHRNWIVIVDSAYPWQSRDGIDTVLAGADHLAVVRGVLAALDKTRHVKPTVYVDAELAQVAETDAPGISTYRQELEKALGGRTVNSLPHEEIIGKLDKAAEVFRVLVLKTDLALPYTSVFLQLECGYWSAGAEQRLREAMRTTPKQ